MLLNHLHISEDKLHHRRSELYRAPEDQVVAFLLEQLKYPDALAKRIQKRAIDLIKAVREADATPTPIEIFLRKYDLNSEQGLALMMLAESLLRVDDSRTANALVEDKIGHLSFDLPTGDKENLLTRTSEKALSAAAKLLGLGGEDKSLLSKGIASAAKPFIVQGVRKAISMMGGSFILGETIQEAIDHASKPTNKGYMFSYDMLGEAAKTKEDAEKYYRAYLKAIIAIGKGEASKPIHESPGISVKLSALHPRYEHAQTDRLLEELVPKLAEICRQAKLQNIGMTIDAEEADRLELSLNIIERVLHTTDLKGWNGLGLAVQAYQKRSPAIIDWVVDQAKRHQRQFMVRLVKGAYWDAEIKLAQEQGLSGYPVFTRKVATDVAYLYCAQKMFAASDYIYPAFGTHNAYTIAAIHEMSGGKPYELQKLYGMGNVLYGHVLNNKDYSNRVRAYVPVGYYTELLPYLVRRLLENGANSSFVNQIFDKNYSPEDLAQNPVEILKSYDQKEHPNIPLPKDIYRVGVTQEPRDNSAGIDLSDHLELKDRADEVITHVSEMGNLSAFSIISGKDIKGETREVFSPADHRDKIGIIHKVGAAQVDQAFTAASNAFHDWSMTPAHKRAKILEKAADLLQARISEYIAILGREGGRTIEDSISEIREAIDFCRYYALEARAKFSQPIKLPGPTGESNEMTLNGRGVFVCISPWNFPLAIFLGQITAALAAGNCVLAKPAEHTCIVAYKAVKLLHEAGIPKDVLHLIIGDGSSVGQSLTSDLRVAGIAFTGSTATAQRIQMTLAERGGPIVPFIAETGGQNAFIVDSSALPEQVVRDIMMGGFRSAGQRCSATRVVFLQDDIAPRVEKMLVDAMEELRLGDPLNLSTDVGPVISMHAATELNAHIDMMRTKGKILKQSHLPADAVYGNFVVPTAIAMDSLDILDKEVFGPVVHMVRFSNDSLDKVCEAINKTGYGLTLGIHSRVDSNINFIRQHARVGNMYVNRSQIGAVVGANPFGGEGLSGTGFKAGGPHYLLRFATERVFSVNMTAAGGNASLIALGGEG